MFLYIVFVTLETGFVAPVLNRKIFPFLYVAEPVIVVRKTVTVDAEIVRNQELPGEQNQSYKGCKTCRFTFTSPCTTWHLKGYFDFDDVCLTCYWIA